MPATFSSRRGHRARVGGRRAPRSVSAATARLLVDRRDDAVDDAAVLGALADGEDALVARDAARSSTTIAALDVEARGARELDPRPDADRDDDEVGVELVAVGEAQAASRR